MGKEPFTKFEILDEKYEGSSYNMIRNFNGEKYDFLEIYLPQLEVGIRLEILGDGKTFNIYSNELEFKRKESSFNKIALEAFTRRKDSGHTDWIMKLTDSNLRVFEYKEGYALKIMMPDGSQNYLHSGERLELIDLLEERDRLLGQEISSHDIGIKSDDKYFRLVVRVDDGSKDKYYFHSRKINLNDAVFERMQLIISND